MKLAILIGFCILAVVNCEDISVKKNLFREYFSRGMYDCTRQYLGEVHKLHLLIREIYDNYSVCKREMESLPKSYPDTGNEALNELLHNYKQRDAAEQIRNDVDNPFKQ